MLITSEKSRAEYPWQDPQHAVIEIILTLGYLGLEMTPRFHPAANSTIKSMLSPALRTSFLYQQLSLSEGFIQLGQLLVYFSTGVEEVCNLIAQLRTLKEDHVCS